MSAKRTRRHKVFTEGNTRNEGKTSILVGGLSVVISLYSATCSQVEAAKEGDQAESAELLFKIGLLFAPLVPRMFRLLPVEMFYSVFNFEHPIRHIFLDPF
jgi:hypothetical protein